MIYSEELAKQILEKGFVTRKTTQVWKHRGAIPDVYGNPNYVPSKLSEADIFLYKKLKGIIDLEKIHVTVLSRTCGMRVSKIGESFEFADRTGLTSKELLAIKKIINTIRVDVGKVITELEKKQPSIDLYDSLMNNSLLVRIKIIPNKLYYDRSRKRKKGLLSIVDQDEIRFVVHHLKIFQAELSI